MIRRPLLLALAAVALAACASTVHARPAIDTAPPSPSPSASTLQAYPPGWVLPDRQLTPGVSGDDITADCPHVDPALEQGRPSQAVKDQVFREYGMDPATIDRGKWEIDHLDALGIAGTRNVALANSIQNLWPEPNVPTPIALIAKWNAPAWLIHNPKDLLEYVLRGMVCSGKLPLATAQQAEMGDWRAAFAQYVGQP